MIKTQETSLVPNPRSLARLLAVQTLFRLRFDGSSDPKTVMDEMVHLHLGADEGVPLITEVDRDFFEDIVSGAHRCQADLKGKIERVLTGEWRYHRLENILAVILEAATYELTNRLDVPKAVVMDEYVELTKAFYEGKEPGFVNGILQELTKTLRP